MPHAVVIIGAGFSGTMVAVHLLRHPRGPSKLHLIDSTGRFGPGLAYSTPHGEHVLNVPAGRMSAFADKPADFEHWLSRTHAGSETGAFVPRAHYGRYIHDLLDDEDRASPGRLERIPASATSITRTNLKLSITLASHTGTHTRLEADHAVIAIGNPPPADPAITDPSFYNSARYHRDPWGFINYLPTDLEDDATASILLIGTGLTMIDIALSLHKGGHAGTIHAVSRRGLLPAPHRPAAPSFHPHAPPDLTHWPRTAQGLLRSLRAAIRDGEAGGTNWREVVTSLRHDTPRLWASLPPKEKQRFLARLRPYWEVVRHRAAPQPAAELARLIDRGIVRLQAGRIESLVERGDAIDATLKLRREPQPLDLRIAHVVNCTGPDTDCARSTDPLLASLVKAGLAAPDPLCQGLLTSPDGRILARDGAPPSNLWLIGPLRKPELWETTAVPELRQHAADLAAKLVRRDV